MRAGIVRLQTNRLFVSLNFFVTFAPVSIDQSERVPGISTVVRIEFDRLAVTVGGFAVLLQIIICQTNIEIHSAEGRSVTARREASIASVCLPSFSRQKPACAHASA